MDASSTISSTISPSLILESYDTPRRRTAARGLPARAPLHDEGPHPDAGDTRSCSPIDFVGKLLEKRTLHVQSHYRGPKAFAYC